MMHRKKREFSIFNMSALDLFASGLGAFILLTIIVLPYYLKTTPVLREEVRQCKADLAETQAANQALQQQLAACEQQRDQQRQAAEQASAAAEQARAELEQERAQRQQAQQQLQQAQSQLQQAQTQLQSCQEENQRLQGEVSECRSVQGDLGQCRQEQQRMASSLAQCQVQLSRTFLAVVIQWPTSNHDIDLHVIDPAGAEFYYSKRSVSGRPGRLSVDTTHGPGVEIWEVATAEVGTYKVYYKFFAHHDNRSSAQVIGGVYYRDGHHRLPNKVLTRVGEKTLVAVIEVGSDGRVSIRNR